MSRGLVSGGPGEPERGREHLRARRALRRHGRAAAEAPEGSPGRDPDGFPGKVANAACPVWLIEMGDDQVIESGWAAKV
jgi:hypothetical protein